jgi:hypothetical protein
MPIIPQLKNRVRPLNDKTIDLSKINFIDKIEVKEDGTLAIYLNRSIEIICNSDLLFTIKGEIGVLAENQICLDSKKIHLNSRNCKQIREMEEALLELLLNEIGSIPEVDANKLEEAKNAFKEQIKREIKEDLKREIMDKVYDELQNYQLDARNEY